MGPTDRERNVKRDIPSDNSKAPTRDTNGWSLKKVGTIVTIIFSVVFGVGGAGLWLTNVIDGRVTHHTETVSKILDTVSETLSSQIRDVKDDVRHFDKATREADDELRKDIKNMGQDVTQMKGDLKKLSEDVELLAHKRGKEETLHNATIRTSRTRP